MSSVYEIITEKIIKQLESGVTPWRKPWAWARQLRRPGRVRCCHGLRRPGRGLRAARLRNRRRVVSGRRRPVGGGLVVAQRLVGDGERRAPVGRSGRCQGHRGVECERDRAVIGAAIG